jgi:hypothetical protein
MPSFYTANAFTGVRMLDDIERTYKKSRGDRNVLRAVAGYRMTDHKQNEKVGITGINEMTNLSKEGSEGLKRTPEN